MNSQLHLPIKPSKVEKILLGSLLFAPALFAFSVEHYLSTWSILVLLYGLLYFCKNLNAVFTDKTVLVLTLLLTGFFFSALISNTLAGWPRLTIKALEADSKQFLVVFWLLAIYAAKDSWVWFYRSLPIAAVLIGLDVIHIFLKHQDIRALYEHSNYNPIDYAGFCAILFYLISVSFNLARWDNLLNNSKLGLLQMKVLYFIATTILFFSIVVSLTRTAWLLFIVLACCYLLLFFSKKTIGLIILFVILISFSLMQNSQIEKVLQNRVVMTVTEVQDYSNNPPPFDTEYLGSIGRRLAEWQASLMLIERKPFFGYGSGNAGLGMNQLYDEGLTYITFVTDLSGVSNIHNMYLNVIANKGLLGFTFFILIFAYLIYFFLSRMKTHKELACMGFFHTLGFALMCLFNATLIHNVPTMLFLPLVFIYVAHIRYLERESDASHASRASH